MIYGEHLAHCLAVSYFPINACHYHERYLVLTKCTMRARTPMFIAVLFTITKTWEQPKCPSTYNWLKKLWYIYAMEYYSAIKEWNAAICNIMDEPRDYHIK